MTVRGLAINRFPRVDGLGGTLQAVVAWPVVAGGRCYRRIRSAAGACRRVECTGLGMRVCVWFEGVHSEPSLGWDAVVVVLWSSRWCCCCCSLPLLLPPAASGMCGERDEEGEIKSTTTTRTASERNKSRQVGKRLECKWWWRWNG